MFRHEGKRLRPLFFSRRSAMAKKKAKKKAGKKAKKKGKKK